MMPTFLLLAANEVVIMTTFGAASDYEVGIITVLGFQWHTSIANKQLELSSILYKPTELNVEYLRQGPTSKHSLNWQAELPVALVLFREVHCFTALACRLSDCHWDMRHCW